MPEQGVADKGMLWRAEMHRHDNYDGFCQSICLSSGCRGMLE